MEPCVNQVPIVWNMCEHLHYESVYFKELHKEQEYHIQSRGSCITSYTIEVGSKLTTLFVYFFNSQNQRAKAGSMAFRSRNFHAMYLGAGNEVSSGTHEIGLFTRSEIKG